MYKGRLFTFGCSFTQYKWPTWADLLGQEFKSYYNFGKSGGGNLFIACSVAEANARYKFTVDDTILIMWTNVTREDRYLQYEWLTPGNIFTQQLYSKEFIKNFITIKGCYIRDLAQIFLVDSMLKDIRCSYSYMSIVDMHNFDQYNNLYEPENQYILDLYSSVLDKFKPSVHKIIFNYDWSSVPMLKKKLRTDFHPLPLEHIRYIEHVLPEFKFKDETLELAKNINNEIKFHFDTKGFYNQYNFKNLKIKNSASRF